MKNTVYIMGCLAAMVIIFAIIINSSPKPERKKTEPPSQDFTMVMQSTTLDFWDKVNALQSTAGSETSEVTDENGNVVSGEYVTNVPDGQSDPVISGAPQVPGISQPAVTQAPAEATQVPETTRLVLNLR
ncbi:MAG: hypothetical protein Q4F95_09010 [Oscillospiraceae bacterium]|nr:hypothetical protein [Oscillospiraceae bacterium]